MIRDIISYLLIGFGLIMASFGVLGLYRFNNIYMRLSVSSNVDAVGILLVLCGALINSPDIVFGSKVIIIIVLSLITSPLSSHAISRSAYESGYRTK